MHCIFIHRVNYPYYVSALTSRNSVLDIKYYDADIRSYFTGYAQLNLDIPYTKNKTAMKFKPTYINVILKTF
jgi:hypothetical protein